MLLLNPDLENPEYHSEIRSCEEPGGFRHSRDSNPQVLGLVIVAKRRPWFQCYADHLLLELGFPCSLLAGQKSSHETADSRGAHSCVEKSDQRVCAAVQCQQSFGKLGAEKRVNVLTVIKSHAGKPNKLKGSKFKLPQQITLSRWNMEGGGELVIVNTTVIALLRSKAEAAFSPTYGESK